MKVLVCYDAYFEMDIPKEEVLKAIGPEKEHLERGALLNIFSGSCQCYG